MKTKYLHTETFSCSYHSFDDKLRGMDTQIAIYALIDPRTKLPFYVGKTNDPKVRLKGHRTGRGTTPSAAFIREIRAEGHRPEMEILELCDEKDWQDREAFWVDFYQFRFGETQVLNVMEGGVQSGRFMKHSAATCERLRQMFKGRPIPQEQREQISKSLTGKVQSKETGQKRLATIKERRIAAGLEPHVTWNSHEEYRAAGRAAYNITRTRQRRERGALIRGSEEWKRNAAEKSRARYDSLDDEQKKAFASQRRGKPGANKGRKFGPLSLEQRAKLSAIHKQRLAVLTPEQREARMASARKAQPAAWKALIASKAKEERKAMMAAANAANPMKRIRQGE
jgi:hypothetical protein